MLASELSPDEATQILARSPLHSDVVAHLLEHGADPDGLDGAEPPLVRASRYPAAAVLLLEAGATPVGPAVLGAVKGRLPALVLRLLHAGAPTEAWDAGNKSPLHLAAAAGRVDLVAFLLTAGAAVDAYRGTAGTPLLAAVEHPAVVWTLLRAGAAPDGDGAAGWTPLEAAAHHGQAQSVASLLEAGADTRGTEAVAYAARHGLPLVTLLLDAGAPAGASLVHAPDEVLDVLLGAGAGVDAVNHEGFTALGVAASRGDLARGKQLLARGASAAARDGHGRTPLMSAAGHRGMFGTSGGQVPLVDLLLAAGADVGATDPGGRTAADHAREAGHPALAERLR